MQQRLQDVPLDAAAGVGNSADAALLKSNIDAIIDPHDRLILAVQHFLSLSGMAFSTGAVRDLADLTREHFDPLAAISALRHVGFEASYGEMAPKRLQPSHCPAIGFTKTGAAIVIVEITKNGTVMTRRFGTDDALAEQKQTLEELSQDLLPYIILARNIHAAAKPNGKNEWFWGSLLRGKWLYAQVLVAAALTNFLGLSTSLFIMVVYDRVVPNEAIESLIALTIGVLIALGFDFIIKTLRAQFVDKAGKRADARMSRLIFDKILTMRLDSRRQKSGAMASIVREFDTLREFFTSATLIAIVDLPFVFFFIWVISLISGPLAIVPLIAVPIVLVVGLGVQPLFARITEGSMQSNMSKQSVLVETLNGLETVQATGSGRLMRRRFEESDVVTICHKFRSVCSAIRTDCDYFLWRVFDQGRCHHHGCYDRGRDFEWAHIGASVATCICHVPRKCCARGL